LLSCSDNQFINPDPPDQLVVYCVLIPDVPRQKVWVSKVAANDKEPPIAVNEVSVWLNDFELNLRDTTDYQNPYNFFIDDIPLHPDSTYTLRVESDEFPDVTGETTIPGDFEVHVDLSTNKLFWSPSHNAAGYQIDLVNLDSSETIIEVTRVYDRQIYFPVNTMPPGQYLFRVGAFDQHYYDFVVAGKEAAGLTNGIGLMGALYYRWIFFTYDGS
ncbi:MAG: DUF4249 family protein, partial [Calditrichaeota bacterium]